MGTLENTCNQFLKYDLSNTFKKCSFTTATSILVKQDILNIVNNIISECTHITNTTFITPQQMLSAYLITYFHKDVLSDPLSEKEQFVFNKSKELVDYLDNIDTTQVDISGLIKKLNTYTYIFKNWLKKDAESQVHIYCDIYHDYNYKIQELIEKKDEVYDSYIQELEKLRNYTKSCIEKLIGVEKASETIQNYVYREKTYDENVEKLVKSYLKKAFWTDFKDRLLQQEPDYRVFNKIFTDIRQYTRLTPIYTQIEETICDFGMLIDSGDIEHTEIIEYVKRFISIIQQMDTSPHYDIIYDKFDEISNNKQFVDIVVYSLTFIMERLENS